MIISKNILNKLYDNKIYIICLLVIIFLFIIIYLYVNNRSNTKNSNNSNDSNKEKNAKEKFDPPPPYNSISEFDLDSSSTRVKSWTVPNGVTQVTITVYGAAGGNYWNQANLISRGGYGASVTATTLSVSQGDKYNFYMASNGNNNFNGYYVEGGLNFNSDINNIFEGGGGITGGGAASYITLNNSSTPLIIAGGGGGAGPTCNGGNACINNTYHGSKGSKKDGTSGDSENNGTDNFNVSSLNDNTTNGSIGSDVYNLGGGGGGSKGGSGGDGIDSDAGGAGGSFVDSTKFNDIVYSNNDMSSGFIKFEYYDPTKTATTQPATTQPTLLEIQDIPLTDNQALFLNISTKQTWIAPAGISQVFILLVGGFGGSTYSDTVKIRGGYGTIMYAILPVTPGNTYNIYVGNNGSDGYYGSLGGTSSDTNNIFGGGNGDIGAAGGGAASFITDENDNILILAGGGGGAGAIDPVGKNGGIGGDGCIGLNENGDFDNSGNGGNGGNYLNSTGGTGGSGSSGGIENNPTGLIHVGLNGVKYGGGGGGGYNGGGVGKTSEYGYVGGGAGGSFSAINIDIPRYVDLQTSINDSSINLINGVAILEWTNEWTNDWTNENPYSDTSIKQPDTSTTQPQTYSFVLPKPQITTTKPQTTSTQPQTTSTQPQITSTQPKTTSTRPQTTSTQPKTTSTQPQTTSTQLQTTSTRPQTTSTQPQTTTIQNNINTSIPNTTMFNSLIANSESDIDTIMRDIHSMFPDISSNEIVKLVNSGANVNNLSPTYNNSDSKYFNSNINNNGKIYDYKNPSLDIIQLNFDGTSNVYSPYIYYDKNLHEKFI